MNMKTSAAELDIVTILRNIFVVNKTIGEKWLFRKMKEEKRRQKQDRSRVKNRKHSYLYRASAHPLIQWSIEAERWREACIKSRKMELREGVLKLSILGQSLERAKKCKGFKRLLKRLKMKKEFYAAAFEAEVAASYVANNWDVEFVEEGGERSPDLKIIRDDGEMFWAECKCRDILTERDKNIDSFWNELEAALTRFLGPKKLNYAIYIRALKQPEHTQLTALKDFILDVVDKGGVGSFDIASSKVKTVSDPTGYFHLSVTKIANSDEDIKTSSIGFQASKKIDRAIISSEVKRDGKGNTYYRNPIIIAFSNAEPSDKVTGIVHAFKSAIGQLPKNDAGVVWVRVPDNAWSDNLDKSFKQAESLLKAELKGTHNQRVNVVFLFTRLFEKLEKNGMTGLSYKPLQLAVEHENPRQPVKKNSSTDTV